MYRINSMQSWYWILDGFIGITDTDGADYVLLSGSSLYVPSPTLTPTPAWSSILGISVKGVVPTASLSSPVSAHGAITIISTSTWENICDRVFTTFLEAGGR
jgi:hypothetical protein